jgi:RNA ligase (TIGR02306 family)
MDVTDILGVTQYVEPETSSLSGDTKGELQNLNILVSDEERLENLNDIWNELKKFMYVVSEKLEGASVTFYLKKGEFGCCSRKLNLKDSENNKIWRVARALDIENKMKKHSEEHHIGNFCLQGEIVGEGVQGNIYKLKGNTVRFYNAFDIDKQKYIEYNDFMIMMNEMGLDMVPIIDNSFTLPETPDELFNVVDKTHTVFGNNPKQLIEGYVLVAVGDVKGPRITRSAHNRLSFKCKSRTYEMNK